MCRLFIFFVVAEEPAMEVMTKLCGDIIRVHPCLSGKLLSCIREVKRMRPQVGSTL